MEKIDDQKSESSEYETDEEWEIERKKHMASIEKEKVLIGFVLYSEIRIYSPSKQCNRILR